MLDKDGRGIFAVIHPDHWADARARGEERYWDPPAVRCRNVAMATGWSLIRYGVGHIGACAVAGMPLRNQVPRAKCRVGADVPDKGEPGGTAAARPVRHGVEVSRGSMHAFASRHARQGGPACRAWHRAPRRGRMCAGHGWQHGGGLSQRGYGAGREEEEKERRVAKWATRRVGGVGERKGEHPPCPRTSVQLA